MVMYVIALMTLLDKLRPEALGIKFTQAWYADDASNVARLMALRFWCHKPLLSPAQNPFRSNKLMGRACMGLS